MWIDIFFGTLGFALGVLSYWVVDTLRIVRLW